MDTLKLLETYELDTLSLSNRMVMAPMTRNRAEPGNVLGKMNIEYYQQRASAGLIITEGTQVSQQGVGYPNTPGIYTAAHSEAWKAVTGAVHTAGGHIFAQLWYCGRISHSSMQADNALPMAPSAIAAEGEAVTYSGMRPFETPHALSEDEIGDVVKQFRHAAGIAKEAGFDGIELHAANGYLIDQFLRSGTNRRDDGYGGSVENRIRFLLEIVEAVTQVWPLERVCARISPENSFNSMHDEDPAVLFNAVASALSGRVGILHVVEGDFAAPDAPPKVDYHTLRRLFAGIYIANRGYTRERAEQSLQENHADLISFGCAFLANLDLPRRFALNAPLNEPDQSTFYGGDEKGYTDYPALNE